MIGRLAVRSLTAHPIRSAVLAAGFGAGVGVMAILLGVAEVVLDQAASPALVGGGDVVIRMSGQVPARMVLSGTLQATALRDRVKVAAPWHTDELYLVRDDGTTVEVDARGGIPSLERALADNETSGIPAWSDSPEDEAWTNASPEDALRQLDRFHPIPDAPAWSNSWAEWLYFNGRAADARFYLTFLVGPRLPDGRRAAGVRLQLDRDGQVESFTASAALTDEEVMRAPELTIGANSVRLDGLRYQIELDLAGAAGRRVRGSLTIAGVPGRLIPPLEITGAKGWRTGYVVPVMSGSLDGEIAVGNTRAGASAERIAFDGGAGYHDHNWGFWQGVSWQWGQVQQGDLSFLYGRVFPPRDAADPERIPGFVGALGPDGPLGYATDVTIIEQNDERGEPKSITVRGRGPSLDLSLRFDVASTVTSQMTQGPLANGVNFLQMRGNYTVSGTAGAQKFDFTAPGAAETFRGGPVSDRSSDKP
ncbi:MAG: hypothetical protein ABL993_07500 [Vicinamibacterales bacterium]